MLTPVPSPTRIADVDSTTDLGRLRPHETLDVSDDVVDILSKVIVQPRKRKMQCDRFAINFDTATPSRSGETSPNRACTTDSTTVFSHSSALLGSGTQ